MLPTTARTLTADLYRVVGCASGIGAIADLDVRERVNLSRLVPHAEGRADMSKVGCAFAGPFEIGPPTFRCADQNAGPSTHVVGRFWSKFVIGIRR